MWSKDDSRVKTTGPSETICKSLVKPFVKTFAVLSKVAEKVGDTGFLFATPYLSYVL